MIDLNIVIISYNWPPRNAIGTHRPYAWARHWRNAGANVTVLTAQKQSFDEPLDLLLPKLEGVEVIEISSNRATSILGRVLKSQKIRSLAKKMRLWFVRRGNKVTDPRMSWRGAAEARAEKLAQQAHVVVSTFGPSSAHLIGYDMKVANPHIFWVADYRDLWSLQHTSEVTENIRKAERQLEISTVGAKADLLSTVSKDLADQLSSFLGKEVLELPNGFDIDEKLLIATFSSRPVKPNGPLRIVYTGMIYDGHRDPTPLLDALVALQADGVLATGEVTVDFYGGRVDSVKRLALNPLYLPFIRIMGHVTREEALQAQRSAGLLLLLESSAPEAKGVLTGKLFEYISSGRPILCVGSRPEYEIGSLLVRTGTGRVFGPNELAQLKGALSRTFSGEGLYAEYSADISEILKYSRGAQSEFFLACIMDRLQHNNDQPRFEL